MSNANLLDEFHFYSYFTESYTSDLFVCTPVIPARRTKAFATTHLDTGFVLTSDGSLNRLYATFKGHQRLRY